MKKNARSQSVRDNRRRPVYPVKSLDELLELETDNLYVIGSEIKIATKQLNETKPKIIRKRKQEKSKRLKDCAESYEQQYRNLIESATKLHKLIPKDLTEVNEQTPKDKQCRGCETRQLQLWKEEQDNKRLQKEIDDLKTRLNKEVNPRDDELRRLQKELEYLKTSPHKQVNAKDDEIRSLQKQVDDLKMRLNKEVHAKEDAIKRLSELAASKLRDNNPNVADLSDQNRPTKLAEQLSELYDNEWTEAFDELENDNPNTEDIVGRLRDIFMSIYTECKSITSNGYLRRVRGCINQTDMMLETNTDAKPRKDESSDLPDQLKQQVKEFRKLDAKNNMIRIVQGMLCRGHLKYLQEPPFNQSCTNIYVKKCIELAWLMCVQDPPLLLSVDTKKEFNPNLFREYTKRGPCVAYVVWPVLYLHENGPVLNKGVAQGTRDIDYNHGCEVEDNVILK